MKTFISTIIFYPVMLFVLTIGFASCTTSAKNDTKDNSLAIDNYRSYCTGCHGENLERFEDKAWIYEAGTSSAEKSIKYGIPKIGMPAFEVTFTDSEIEGLAIYIKEEISAKKD